MIITDNIKEVDLKKERLVLKADINRRRDGKYELKIETVEATDGLTTSVFIYKSNQVKYVVRDVKRENSNIFYIESAGNEVTSEIYEEEFSTFEEAYEKLIEILSEVEKNRNLVRDAKREYHKFIVI